MINTTQLLRESYVTYKYNFTKLFLMALPILLATYVIVYTSNNFDALIKAKILNLNTVIFGLIAFIGGLISMLYLEPAINRAVQRNEDISIFNSKEGYEFQKKNIFKWIMVNVWGILYLFWKLLPYILSAGLIFVILMGLKNDAKMAVSGAILAGIVLFVGMIMNIHRFLLFKTIIFSKDISARDAVRESIKLGEDHKVDMWKAILSLILLGLAIGMFSIIVGIVASIFGLTDKMYEQYISPIIVVFVTTPMLLIVIAKTYVKIRSVTIPIAPVEEIHTV